GPAHDSPADGGELDPTAADDRRIDPARPALERAHPGEELAEVEWLDEIVVGARVEALDPVGWRVTRGEHDDRGRFAVLARPGDDVDAGRAGHPPIDDRDVVVVPLELVDRVIAALDGVDVVALVFETEDEDVAQAGVVFGDQDAHLVRPAR